MNKFEKRMLEILEELKEDYKIIGVKAEFEAEGTRKNEMIRLQELTNRAHVDTIVKIGGCEAVTDVYECKVLGAKGIVAPMIETPFAMKKYMGLLDKMYTPEEQKELYIVFNAETITAYNNIDAILDVGEGKITNVAIGRVDLSGSMGLTRNEINGDEVFEKVKVLVSKAKCRYWWWNIIRSCSFYRKTWRFTRYF